MFTCHLCDMGDQARGGRFAIRASDSQGRNQTLTIPYELGAIVVFDLRGNGGDFRWLAFNILADTKKHIADYGCNREGRASVRPSECQRGVILDFERSQYCRWCVQPGALMEHADCFNERKSEFI